TSPVSWLTALARPFMHIGLLIAFLNSDCIVWWSLVTPRQTPHQLPFFVCTSMFTDNAITTSKKALSNETFDKATARVILVLDGFAPNSSMTRCFGGGFKFNYINAELIDSLNNETLASYSNSGYSEGCPPLSGSIFEDITNMVFQSVN
ncbi:hypothetical protein N9E28_02880, partial [Alphaproteobacteria bacterium]|nr:hypothetical protein [Alphaproteobacteria bacterium]